MFMDYWEAPGSEAPFPSAVDSGKDTFTIFRGPSVAGTNTGSLTLRPCESASTPCAPLSSTRREPFRDDTISGPSSAWSTILEGEGDEAEGHESGGFGEMETVAIAPAAETVLALEEFVADADAPFTGEGRDIGDGAKVEILGIVAANDHGEGVFEAEGLGDFEVEAIGVELLDAIVHGGGIALW